MMLICQNCRLIKRVKRGQFKIFKNYEGHYPQNFPNQTCDYWLITQSQQTFCIEVNIF